MNSKLITFTVISSIFHGIIFLTSWNFPLRKNHTPTQNAVYARLTIHAATPKIRESSAEERFTSNNPPLEKVDQTLPLQPISPRTPPRLRIEPNLAISFDNTEDQSFKLFLEINEYGRVTNAIPMGRSKIPEDILEKISTSFKNEAIFIPETIDGKPTSGHTILEVKLSK